MEVARVGILAGPGGRLGRGGGLVVRVRARVGDGEVFGAQGGGEVAVLGQDGARVGAVLGRGQAGELRGFDEGGGQGWGVGVGRGGGGVDGGRGLEGGGGGRREG